MHYVGALKLEQFQIPEYYIFLEFIEGKGLDKWYTDRYKTLNDLTLDELRMLVNRILMPMKPPHVFRPSTRYCASGFNRTKYYDSRIGRRADSDYY